MNRASKPRIGYHAGVGLFSCAERFMPNCPWSFPMRAPKSRVTALDWAKAQAINQLRTIVAGYSADSPDEWEWKVGRTLRTDPTVIVTIHDRGCGLMSQHIVWTYLPLMRMQEEIQAFFERTVFQRQAILATMRHRDSK
jgi:hypothetical protein